MDLGTDTTVYIHHNLILQKVFIDGASTRSMDRRQFLAGGGVAGLAGLGSLAGCAFLEAGGDDGGRQVPADWRPGSGEWAHVEAYGPHGNRYNPHATPPRAEPAVDWETDPGHRKRAHPSFVVAGGTMYVRQHEALYALDTETGEELWTEPRSEYGRISYVDGRLYLDRHDGNEALDLSGERIWRMDEPGMVVGEMAGYVYTRTEAGIAWHDTETGDRVGSTSLDTAPGTIVDGTIYGFDDGVAAYEHTGDEPTREWHAASEDGWSTTGDVFVVSDDTIYVGEGRSNRATRVGRYGLDGERLETGPEIPDDHRIRGLVVVDGVEYLSTTENAEQEGIQGSHLEASDGDGETLWEASFERNMYSSPVVANDAVYLSVDADLLALDAATGETLWELEGAGGDLAVVGDTIYTWGLEFRAIRA